MKCEDCNEREGIIHFSNEPLSTVTRGWGGMHICRKCYIAKIKENLKDVQENLEEQEKLLKEDGK